MIYGVILKIQDKFMKIVSLMIQLLMNVYLNVKMMLLGIPYKAKNSKSFSNIDDIKNELYENGYVMLNLLFICLLNFK